MILKVNRAFFIFEQIKSDNEQSHKGANLSNAMQDNAPRELDNALYLWELKPQGICYQAGVVS